MTELILDRNERLSLRADAHHVTMTVLLGSQGLTPAVIKEVDKALSAHGLIKIKVPSDDRDERAEIFQNLADATNSTRIQTIGKTLVLYRPIPEKHEKNEPVAAPKKKVASHKPGEKKKRAAPIRHRAHPKRKRVTKKSAMG